ncbi:DUF4091 domain-containing protein [Treponema sp. HNW]|uniref:DUF4091 domain-containing protein n=1 Tax=Treponema sp. HNW TaxID=3116654 RepID=UPI003D149801
MAAFEFFLVSSLEKVFLDQRPEPLSNLSLNALIGDRIAFQLVYSLHGELGNMPADTFCVTASGIDAPIRLRDVVLLPSHYPVPEKRDKNYLRTVPGLYPDLLVPSSGKIKPVAEQFRSLWIDADLSSAKPGIYRLCISVRRERDSVSVRDLYVDIEVINCKLPEQKLIHTEWFYADCLADYYKVPVFSEAHWKIIANFIHAAVHDCGVNMLLTPVFTPPLDTAIGGERTTTQLVSIEKKKGIYSFDFTLLERWCKLCKQEGVAYLEIAHFFTQWGAKATPKIIVSVDGIETKLFGWHVSASDPEYKLFLSMFIPELLKCLHAQGFDKEHIVFHVSDEPCERDMETYLNAKEIIKPLLHGYTVIDALSSYEFYERGIVENPIPSNDHIQPFIDNKADNLWVYYCVAQSVEVPNRFFAMPCSRNRIMGVLLYLYDIKGFLHWGFNFYNTQYSRKHINPFIVTDCGSEFPSGDAFLVYPADDTGVYSSIRNEIQMEAFADICALQKLETLIGREKVCNIIHEDLDYILTFKKYPIEKEYLTQLRYKINQCIRDKGVK